MSIVRLLPYAALAALAFVLGRRTRRAPMVPPAQALPAPTSAPAFSAKSSSADAGQLIRFPNSPAPAPEVIFEDPRGEERVEARPEPRPLEPRPAVEEEHADPPVALPGLALTALKERLD